MLRLLGAAGLPAPVQQHRVRVGGRTYRLDLAYPDAKIAIELYGWDHHRTRSVFDDDRARANALVLDRWTLLRFTSQSADHTIVGSVTSALAQCGQSGAA